ncbi:cellulose synthase-like protein G3 isoform X2 [Juglans microcarpa x Juglans regia]|uniref:cellulose synthase-like protein G3 isoform X2 n=1 Tax=Juglans microcarpa x Juglans regia TaxID=2249226 RepID=UPI001B7DD4B7|nr:cellulose synthase-like protein G3 isoform X2 [Juglans microcarpa x Juglans regia]
MDESLGTSPAHAPLLHRLRHARRTAFNRMFAAVYFCAILVLLYRHALKLILSTTFASFLISLSFLVSDTFLAFVWFTRQCFLMTIVYREEYLENLQKALLLKKSSLDFPALDVFICTADPYKEPPLRLVSTALSVMAYDYPTEKISVYVSDDGGSQVTLFACMEAAKFAYHWLPFCRKNNIIERSPEAYFAANHSSWFFDTDEIQKMYESMKQRVERVLEKGKVDEEYITEELERKAFSQWVDHGFTRQDHPTVIQVLLESRKNKDATNHLMPNLIYVSREKSRTSSHNFKAGALNVMLRVSATMTNAPIILNLDCDMYSNDPRTPLRALCYLLDPKLMSKLAYVQFPQIFHGINKNDTYSCEYKRPFCSNLLGLDGVLGPNYIGTGCFFNRRAFFGSPSTIVPPEIPELCPDSVVDKSIQSQPVLELAHKVARCNYEYKTKWGYEVGYRYGSLVEDFFTGLQLQCEGWRSIFCNPKRAAFLGDAPISLVDVLNQVQRWSIGSLQVAFSSFSPLTCGIRSLGPHMGLAYTHYCFWSTWFIPLTLYAFLPQLCLLHGLSVFPKLSEPSFILYVFLVLGAYGQDLLEFMIEEGTVQNWWNDQRMWMIRGLSSFGYGSLEFFLKCLGISTYGFGLTNKVIDDEQSKRYGQGMFEFGDSSNMFVPLITAAIVNLVSFLMGLVQVLRGSKMEGLFLQMFLAGFVVLNALPIYEAMVLRNDKGRIPFKTTATSTCLALALYGLVSLPLMDSN